VIPARASTSDTVSRRPSESEKSVYAWSTTIGRAESGRCRDQAAWPPQNNAAAASAVAAT
jgi:hypothetical protein